MSAKPKIVIDGDGHVVESNMSYETIRSEYKYRKPLYSQGQQGSIIRLVDGKIGGDEDDGGFVLPNGGTSAHGKGLAIHYRRAGMHNSWARLPDMDADQIDVAVLYPTHELPLCTIADSGFALARSEAYNNWLHDYCSVNPGRLKGIGIIALQDVETAIEEMRRSVVDLGMVGVQIGCTVGQDTLLSDIRLDPFWRAAEELDVPVAVHGPALPDFFRQYMDVNRPDHILEASHMAHAFAQMLACSNVITSGVLERFSKLRIAFLEAGSGWVPYWMHRMDEYNEVAPERWAMISSEPSDYIKSGRVFFSCEPGDADMPYFLENIGEQAMLFASDYLHFDALFVGETGHDGKPYPGTVNSLLARDDISDSAKTKMMYDNSVAFYKNLLPKDLGKIGDPLAREEPNEVRNMEFPGTIGARLN